jgi:hypothetical protein
MARGRKGSRKAGLFSKMYAPLKHLLAATRNISKSVAKRGGKVVDQGLGAIDNAGSAITKHANMTVRNVTRRRGRKTRRAASRRARR